MEEDKDELKSKVSESLDPNQKDADPVNEEWSTDNNPQVKISLSRKQKIIIAIVAIILIAETAFIAYHYLKPNDSTLSQNNSSAGQSANEQVTVTKENYEGLDGIDFTVPDKWSLSNSTTEGTDQIYKIYSPDVKAPAEGYIPISGGITIEVSSMPRDKTIEKNTEKPLENYSTSIGSPKIKAEGVDFYEQKTDTSKIKYFTNQNGVDFVAYPWAYEGCFIRLVALDEDSVYFIAMYSGENDCLPIEALESNSDIASFVNSIKLTNSKGNISSFSMLDIDIAKDQDNKYDFSSKDLSFTFSMYKDPEFKYFIAEPAFGVPMLTDDSKFEKIIFSSTVDIYKEGYTCVGCGFLNGVYDSAMLYSAEETDASGYQQITEEVFGKVDKIEPIQANAQANRYTYLKRVEGGTFTFTFAAEASNSEKLPDLQAEYIINTVKSIEKK
jgi:hypothetical protein